MLLNTAVKALAEVQLQLRAVEDTSAHCTVAALEGQAAVVACQQEVRRLERVVAILNGDEPLLLPPIEPQPSAALTKHQTAQLDTPETVGEAGATGAIELGRPALRSEPAPKKTGPQCNGCGEYGTLEQQTISLNDRKFVAIVCTSCNTQRVIG